MPADFEASSRFTTWLALHRSDCYTKDRVFPVPGNKLPVLPPAVPQCRHVSPCVWFLAQEWFLDHMVSTHAGARTFKDMGHAGLVMKATISMYLDYTEDRARHDWQ